MDSDQPHNDTLWATNRLLSDLERKLSIVSNTSSSSNQTQQSHASSVIVDRNFSGIGKQNIQSSVLQYIKANEEEFNPNELFEERQQKFLTKLGRTYNDDKYASANSQKGYVTNFDSKKDNFYENNGDIPNGKGECNIQNSEENEDQSQHESRFNATPEMNYDDEDDTYVDEGDGNEKMFFDDDDDLLLSPEPPRSPPREIDPDKVYGLYDFSGPDPLHCILSRDEPVYLLNDEDNYWCLIKKLSKEERIAVISQRLNGSEEVPKDPFGDEEYGKIGFVPAECLETYGERLARLNCFKNEELEKLSRENLNNDDSIQILENDPSALENNSAESNLSHEIIPSTNLIRRNTKTNKSVTFEDLGILDFYDQEDDNVNKEEFGQHLLTISHDELQSLSLPRNDEDKTSEVLSDVYPNEMPLVINKNNDKRGLKSNKSRGKATLIDHQHKIETQSIVTHSPEIIEILDGDDDAETSHTILIDREISENKTGFNRNNSNNVHSSDDVREAAGSDNADDHNADEDEVEEIIFNNPYKEFMKPPIFNENQQDNSSIGSFSPDTPPQRKKFSSSNLGLDEQAFDDEADMSSIRRSNVLDRLNKITSDIQEQLNLNGFDYESYSNDNDFLQNLKSSSISSDLKNLNKNVEDEDEDEDEYDFDDYDGYDDYDDDYYYRNESEQDEQRDSDGIGIITPLTSSNSLTNGILPSQTDITDKRKSKPVHEMFMPVLGKFDLLAEKLARLDELV
ncbi:uncharacterized protein AC631_03302 [Debaryomyces fabryi]|uniref:SH3 domain-containing protein n=1 Tax=Debaryomyces fabryi TaxID=58627 RepID=A0A0V1PXD8_9ASCO|nr:uncharacterized protein AC631_03302 [Debaryomyces fabryi]KSA00932.1 hypothetical protein AC631_03302 [Debaryomyces fabryi]CUM52403.1 unnamed protein product [Debaryomyces fabryi]